MKASYVAVGVVGLLLGGVWYAAGGAHPPARAGEHLHVAAPLSHENLTVYFVHGPDAIDTARVVTLQEALERKWAVVHETGQVSQLVVENLSPDYDLFVQSGDIIKGGRQDRMIASDMLIPPGAGAVPVASHCVEQSRWSGRGTEAAAYFAVSDSVAVGNPIKVANANRDQSLVWANVKANQDKLSENLGVRVNAAASPTSLQLALENPAVRAKVDEYRRALAAAGADHEGVVGAVFVVNGKVSSAEVYGSSGLFLKAWPKLLKAASEEALVEKPTGRTPAPPTAREVEQFLAASAKPTPIEHAAQREQVAGFLVGDFETAAPGAAVNVQPEPALNFRGRSAGTHTVLLRAGSGNLTPADDRVGRVIVEGNTVMGDRVRPGDANQWGTPPTLQQAGLFTPRVSSANPDGNRVSTSRVETESTLLLESRDAGKKVIHRSYIKK